MIDLTPEEAAGALTWEAFVSSWRGGQWLADVPVAAGSSVTWSTRREVPGSLDLIVPRQTTVGGRLFDWLPDSDRHPLSHHGQVLYVSLRVTTAVSKRSWTLPYGRFGISKWEQAEGEVRVSGVSLMQRVVDDRLPSPTPTRTGGTYASEVRRLVPASLGVAVDPGLEDRLVPAMSWDEDRMAAILEVAKAWPARVREDMDGIVRFLPMLGEPTSPDLYLADLGVTGTVASAYLSGSREGIYNAVVARGESAPDEPAIQAEARQATGPYDVDTYGTVRRFFASPLIHAHDQAASAAESILADSILPATTRPVVCAPDPRIALDQLVQVDGDGRRAWGWVSGFTMPLTADSDMRVDTETVWTEA